MPGRWITIAAYVCLLGSLAACGGGGTAAPGGGGGGGGGGGPTEAAPAAQIQIVSTASGLVGTTLRFFGQGADPDCTALTYAWDLDGDGGTDATLQSPTATYGAAGEFPVTLTVTDAGGMTATATCVVSIRTAPAAMTASPGVQVRCHTLLAEEDVEAFFIAEAADLDGGSITSYDWDFDGDGAFELNTVTPNVTRTLPDPGQLTVTVRANSDDGSTSTATLTMYLCNDGSMPDVSPGVQVELDPAGPNVFVAGGTARYLAPGGDIDGGALTLDWDTDNDASFGDAAGRSITSLAWPSDGALRIRGRATDDEGRTSEAQASARIMAGPLVGTFPTAQARACTLLGSTNTPIQFLGEGDDLETAVTFSWDFNGDGVEDSADQNPTFAFATAGVYVPTLTVDDGDGHPIKAYLTLVVDCCVAGGGGPPGPYWWCDCPDTVMLHGGSVGVVVACPVLIGSAGPTNAAITSCAGQLGFLAGDPGCAQIALTQPGGAPFPPPAAPPGPAVGQPFAFNVTSTAVDGPNRFVDYTVTLRLIEPGIRVQILKCQVRVVHGVIQWGILPNHTPPRHDVVLTDNTPGGGSAVPGVAPITVIEFEHASQNPAWDGSEFTMGFHNAPPPGWLEMTFPDRIVFELADPMMGNPIIPGVQFAGQFEFAFFLIVGPPVDAVINMYDDLGNRVGQEVIQIPP